MTLSLTRGANGAGGAATGAGLPVPESGGTPLAPRRVCPDCGGRKDEGARRCRPCAATASRIPLMEQRYWPVEAAPAPRGGCACCVRGLFGAHGVGHR